MPDHICTILLEGSEDASYEENTSIFDEVFKYIDSHSGLVLLKICLTPQQIINSSFI